MSIEMLEVIKWHLEEIEVNYQEVVEVNSPFGRSTEDGTKPIGGFQKIDHQFRPPALSLNER